MKKKTVLVAIVALVLVLAVAVACIVIFGGNGGSENGTEQTTEAVGTTSGVDLGTSAYQPMDMVGNWVMTAVGDPYEMTEVSGERGTVEITGQELQELTVSYTDNETPEDCFYQKPLMPWVGQMYEDCGNSAWAADVDYTGQNNTTYVLTLRDDGVLLMEVRFELEGMQIVSYRTFARAE